MEYGWSQFHFFIQELVAAVLLLRRRRRRLFHHKLLLFFFGGTCPSHHGFGYYAYPCGMNYPHALYGTV